MEAQCGLEIHHVALEAWRRNIVGGAGSASRWPQFLALDPVEAKPLDHGGEARIACGEASALAGRHVLVRVEAEDLRVAEASDSPTAVLRTDRVCGVLED